MDLKHLINQKIKLDSNQVNKGDVFVAIGKGHNYIKDAIKNGAKYVISEKKYHNKKVSKVNNTVEFLGLLANQIRVKYDIPLIAITGSTGKTTTKEFIYELLKTKYNVLKSEKNNNNHIGVPKTLLNLTNEHDIAVLELGMNHTGEIAKLSKICNPTCGVITNIGTAHIGNLGSKQKIFEAKLEILEGMNGNTLILNKQDKYLKKVKYNNIYKSNIKVKKVKFLKHYTKFILQINKEEYNVIFNIPGKHMFTDLLLSIQVALLFKVDINDIINTIYKLKNEEGRFKIYVNELTLIDDCYNSSFEALKEGLLHLRNYDNRKVIILSDMLELGKYSTKYHKKVNTYLNKIKNKDVYLYGEYVKDIKGKHFSSIAEMIDNLSLKKNDIVYIKGSNSMNLSKVSEYLKNKYDLQ